jgi:hypothetical protein
MTRASHPTSFDNPNNFWWSVAIKYESPHCTQDILNVSITVAAGLAAEPSAHSLFFDVLSFKGLRRGADKSLAFHISLFAAQPKCFFLDGLKKLEQRSHKCVELRG